MTLRYDVRFAGVLLLLALSCATLPARERPLALHPRNPHYFLFRGKPTLLIGSGEHYGAVVNLDFNYVKYLDTLQSNELNVTRLFVGSYVEPPGAFNIAQNTLAPAPERFICPWARSATRGYANRGNKFDLTQFDPAYFKRLKDFVTQASQRGVVVEVNLFCPFYEEAQWNMSPMNHLNNINNLGAIARTNVYTLDQHAGLLPVQEAMTRRIVAELKDFDNLYYEVCNEPYFGGVTLAWQKHIAETIQDAEKKFARPHLISMNVANGAAKVDDPHPAFSIFNFHYATPPDAVFLNYGLNKAIGDNETGFKGTADFTYRAEAWEFIIAGGSLYNNLDYSFTVGHEDGTFVCPPRQPGGGSAALRRQLRDLKRFLGPLPLVDMRPDNYVLKGGLPEGATARALAQKGVAYAVYIRGGRGAAQVKVEVPAGNYQAEWLEPASGRIHKGAPFKHAGGNVSLASPEYTEDLAVKITKAK